MPTPQKRQTIRAIHARLAQHEPEAMAMANKRRRAWRWRRTFTNGFGFLFGLGALTYLMGAFSQQEIDFVGNQAASGWHGLLILVGCGLLALLYLSTAYDKRWSEPLRYTPVGTGDILRLLQQRWLVMGLLIGLWACASLYPFLRHSSASLLTTLTSFSCMGILLITGAFIWMQTFLRVSLVWITFGLGLGLLFYSWIGSGIDLLHPLSMNVGLQTARYLPLAWPARALSDDSFLLPLLMITTGIGILFSFVYRAWRRSFVWNPIIESEIIEPSSHDPIAKGREEATPEAEQFQMDWESAAREAWRKASPPNASNGCIENRYRSLLTKRDLLVSQRLLGHPGPWTQEWQHTGILVAVMFLLTTFLNFLDLGILPFLLAVLLTIIVVIRTTLTHPSSFAFLKAAQGLRIEGPLYRFLPVSLQELFLLHWKSLIIRHTVAMPWHFGVILLWQILLADSNPVPLWGTLLQTTSLTLLWASWSLAVFALVFISHAYADFRIRPWFLRVLLYLGSLATFIIAGILGLALLMLSALPWFGRSETSLSELALMSVFMIAAITIGVASSYFLPKLRIRLLHRLKHDCGRSRL